MTEFRSNLSRYFCFSTRHFWICWHRIKTKTIMLSTLCKLKLFLRSNKINNIYYVYEWQIELQVNLKVSLHNPFFLQMHRRLLFFCCWLLFLDLCRTVNPGNETSHYLLINKEFFFSLASEEKTNWVRAEKREGEGTLALLSVSMSSIEISPACVFLCFQMRNERKRKRARVRSQRPRADLIHALGSRARKTVCARARSHRII